AFFTEKIPGTLFRLGTTNKKKGITSMLHNTEFDIDEDALSVGVTVLAFTAVEFLEGKCE
ncbi:MAG: amidohydrolase, partial [Deltaproteobacteria bacterium]|nr:amidohydrolase [Deltaproteobacteria bacterium]